MRSIEKTPGTDDERASGAGGNVRGAQAALDEQLERKWPDVYALVLKQREKDSRLK